MFQKSQNKPDLIFNLLLLLFLFLPPRTVAVCLPPLDVSLQQDMYFVWQMPWATSAVPALSLGGYRLPSTPLCCCELKRMSSRGPSNLNKCMVPWPCVLDTALLSQAFFHYLSLPELFLLGLHFAYPACLPAADSLILWLSAVKASHFVCCFWSLSCKVVFSAALTASRQRPGCRCAGAAVHPADQNRLRVSLLFPTFPLSLLLHSEKSLGMEVFLFGLHSILSSEIAISEGSQPKLTNSAIPLKNLLCWWFCLRLFGILHVLKPGIAITAFTYFRQWQWQGFHGSCKIFLHCTHCPLKQGQSLSAWASEIQGNKDELFSQGGRGVEGENQTFHLEVMLKEVF